MSRRPDEVAGPPPRARLRRLIFRLLILRLSSRQRGGGAVRRLRRAAVPRVADERFEILA